MRVSPDGTFHGLRASHLCRVAFRVPVDPGLFKRRLIALHPVIDYQRYISASPDVFPPGHPGYDQGVAADLQIPQALRNEIEDWIGQFKTNFRHLGDRPVDQPVWADGFDEMAWLDRGHALAECLGEHYPEHFVFCCAEKLVLCELAAGQLDYVCAVTGQSTRKKGWRMPGNEPDPDVPAELRLMPEYGVEWGISSGDLPYHQPPRLRTSPGPVGFPTPRSLGLTSHLEDRIWRWNEDWRHGFIADDVDPVTWYREGRAIATQLADELPGVAVRLDAISYLCAPRFHHLTRIFGDDEFFTPLSRQAPETPKVAVGP